MRTRFPGGTALGTVELDGIVYSFVTHYGKTSIIKVLISFAYGPVVCATSPKCRKGHAFRWNCRAAQFGITLPVVAPMACSVEKHKI